ncbi:5-oxoprolinase subunit PxpB [Bacillus sp. FJAT-27245]|uniref:5-oxoprolinase subunit PxpB n=1 Tax=Bacillus sp. FJAT-27245 TaxID=1684144 RepID=UPI0006A7A866|nr:5-oxoprolinase subunit PxpB [Bacillus sp. FJAT-27245]
MHYVLNPLGDRALTVSFGGRITTDIHKRISGFIAALEAARIEGIVECVPTYTSVAIYFHPEKITYSTLCKKINAIGAAAQPKAQPLIYKVPVQYNGPDLQFIADTHQLTVAEVIRLHTDPDYMIHMIGFMPGFPYLGGLPEKLATPRLPQPRPKVPAGAVGIGGSQTGIYPDESPSGWRILGFTPLKLFDINRAEPFLFSPGHYIRFFPIGPEEFARINELATKGLYTVETEFKLTTEQHTEGKA